MKFCSYLHNTIKETYDLSELRLIFYSCFAAIEVRQEGSVLKFYTSFISCRELQVSGTGRVVSIQHGCI
jgi:hypothetical protein